jgi:type 1 glutamine amidotransferase
MSPRFRLAPIVLLFLGLAAWAGAAPPLRVLILSGANNHDWRATTPVLMAALEAGGLCQVVVTENPASLRPNDLAGLDVVLSNFNTFGKKEAGFVWDPEMRAAFIAWIRQGHGFVAVHAGSSVFYDWPEFQALAGTSWGRTSRHAKKHPSGVVIRPAIHAITAGLADFETHDEFWEGSVLAAGATVLATAAPKVEFGGSGKPEPIALATTLGAGRGFTLLLGHDAAAMKHEGFIRLLRRGTEWAASGAVSSPPSPLPQK